MPQRVAVVIGLLIPPQFRVLAALLLVVAVALAGLGAGAYARGVIADRDLSTLRAQHAEEVAQAAQRGAEAERKARAEVDRQTKELEDIANAERIKEEARLAAAARATRAAGGVRSAAKAATDALVSSLAQSTPSTDGGAADRAALGMLADVLGSCGERVAELAAIADEARGRGLACQRAYDAVRSSNTDD